VDVASIEQELLTVLDEEHLNACKVVFEELHWLQLCKKGLELIFGHNKSRM
jgi:hypothetical protein